MRRCLRSRLLTVALLLLSIGYVSAESWQKYHSKQGSYSFHYPSGWKVAESDSAVEITNPSAPTEQLILVAVPFDPDKSPRQLAEDMIEIFRSGTPDLRASDWKPVGSGDVAVQFRTKYTEGGKKFDGHVAVVKEAESAFWFSYSSLLAGYDSARALKLLDGLAGSFATGSASKTPSSIPGARSSDSGARASTQAGDKLDENAKAFLFVLEFSLGAPLTASQEKVILAELLDGWRNESPAELRKFDQYPTLVRVILKMGQSDLESTRSELEAAIREWINEYRGKSPSVVIIENELKRRGRVLVQGEPPLTEMAASAYSEIMAFSELLALNPDADVSEIPDEGIAQYRQRVRTQWGQLSRRDRDLIATSPGLWISLRTLMTHGSAAEQQDTRSLISRLTAGGASSSSSSSGGAQASGKSSMDAMLKHNVLMNIQQQTFNQYMWSRGFNYHPTYGKMW